MGKLWKGTLLIAGTTIGGGVLGLPVLTSLGGFFPAVILYLVCWLFMMITGLLTIEAYFWNEGDPNLISMAKNTIGTWGKIYTWLIYIFLFYCLTLAYTVGCGHIFNSMLGESVPSWVGPVIFVLIFAPFVFAGARVVGVLNIPLMAGLLFFYGAFVVIGLPYVNLENLKYYDWTHSIKALPIAFAAFGFHGTVPTLCRYLDRNVSHARFAVIAGTFIALLSYIVWEWLILGIIPTFGPGGLAEAIEKGQTAVEPLKQHTDHPFIYPIGQGFAFFALVTSFLGVTLGLRDFLADGLGIQKTAQGRFWICVMMYVPTLFLSITYPNIFLEALDHAGGIGGALLLGLLPIMMVWYGRYVRHYSSPRAVFGGKALLILLALFVLFELSWEFAHIFGLR